MNERLNHLLREWALREWSTDGDLFIDQSATHYLGRKVFDDYEPSQFDRFEDRLDRWLHNVDDDQDRQTLFRLMNRLFFIGRSEFESLCRAAFEGPVIRWLVEQLDIRISSVGAIDVINAGVETTWFCPITDSMRINSFLKVNKLAGKSHIPDWRSLRKFGDKAKILEFIQANHIDRIVLLEDFVGSGTQMKSAVNFAATLSEQIPILVCPLVICPGGSVVGSDLASINTNVTFTPVLQLTDSMLIKPDSQEGEAGICDSVRNLILNVKDRLGVQEGDALSQRFHGYKGTGAVVAMYSNCPNNSLPIICDNTDRWSALFPRIKRG